MFHLNLTTQAPPTSLRLSGVALLPTGLRMHAGLRMHGMS
jgi:hypothetical protein